MEEEKVLDKISIFIKKKKTLTSSATHFKRLLNYTNEEKIKFNFKCLMSKRNMIIPVRGTDCEHIECYDGPYLVEYLLKYIYYLK